MNLYKLKELLNPQHLWDWLKEATKILNMNFDIIQENVNQKENDWFFAYDSAYGTILNGETQHILVHTKKYKDGIFLLIGSAFIWYSGTPTGYYDFGIAKNYSPIHYINSTLNNNERICLYMGFLKDIDNLSLYIYNHSGVTIEYARKRLIGVRIK